MKILEAHSTGSTATQKLNARRLTIGLVVLFSGSILTAHDAYLMNSNHTDYDWNATAAESDAAMLAELDFYLNQIDSTSGDRPDEQARYVPDNWWWLRLYETHRTPEQFARLISAIRTGHITVPLNPLVTLYGAMPTEAVIRAGYYPGKIARQYDIDFLLAENMENQTSPWGLASIWAGSQVRYTWKGVCGCEQSAPARTDDELFIWQGPDGKSLLFKWYNLLGSSRNWGGYSEARDNLDNPNQIRDQIQRTQTRMPGIPATGLFGAGWDNVSWQTTAVIDAVRRFNVTSTGNKAIVSNGIDFFQSLESSGAIDELNTLRGGWGNDWDMWPASLAERTARAKRAVEQLRTAELLAAWVHSQDTSFWPPVRNSIEDGLFSLWKYFEHSWSVTGGGPTLKQLAADKEAWVSDFEGAVSSAVTAADARIADLFTTDTSIHVAVFNPLGFERTDYADATVSADYTVIDEVTGLEVPSQNIIEDAQSQLRFLAAGVPSLGYRLYRLEHSSPPQHADAATVTPSTRTIENNRFRVVLGSRGQIVEAVSKMSDPPLQMAGNGGLNDFGSGTINTVAAENVGPVSATLRVDLKNPRRTVRVTLFADVDRIEIENTINENLSGFHTYDFNMNLPKATIRFEEVGAIARPGLVAEGGDFLPGTRASRMTLNHFVAFEDEDARIIISNWDAFSMQVNDSTDSAFDLVGDQIKVVVTEQTLGAAISNQGSDERFMNRFALRATNRSSDEAEAMRTSLAHQNPLFAVPVNPSANGPLDQPTGSLLSLDNSAVVVTAFKPAEDRDAGFVVRMWELNGQDQDVTIGSSVLGLTSAWETSLIESDRTAAPIVDGAIPIQVKANEMKTYRLVTPKTQTLLRRGGRRIKP